MKKILAMVLSVALIASLAIGGTVAYLTDSDEATNVFAVGNVEIELMEEQRDWSIGSDGLVDKTTTLEKFEQNKNLMPIVTKDVNEDGSGKFAYDTLGMNTAQNYQDKIVRVKNTGSSEAWVRIFVAVPAALEDKVGEEGAQTCALHWDVGERFDKDNGSKYNSSTEGNPFTSEFEKADFVSKQTIANTEYNIYSFTRKMPLKAGETTAAAFVGFYLDETVDNNSDDGYYYIGSKKDEANRITVKGVGAKDGDNYYDAYSFEEGVLIPVYAEAVQMAGFATSDDAFSRAIEAGHDAPYDPWTAENATIEVPDTIKTVVELKTALESLGTGSGEKKIVLTPNKVYNFSGVTFDPVYIKNATSVTIEGNNAVITNLSQPLISYSYNPKSITIKDLTIRDANMTNPDIYSSSDDTVTKERAETYGAFIQIVTGNVEKVTLSNCHLVNSRVSSVAFSSKLGEEADNNSGWRVGGLIGYCLLKNSKCELDISNCSVEGSTITGRNVVGGFVGNLVGLSGNQLAQMTVSNSEVKDSSIISTHIKADDSWRIGAIFGSQDNAKTIVTNFTRSGNTLKQDNASTKPDITGTHELYGLKNGPDRLIVDGNVIN